MHNPNPMLLDPEALALLACPVCHASLHISFAPGQVASSAVQELACTGCHRRYPVRDGLPILLESAATIPA